MKGSISKDAITQKILEVFPNSFINEKEIRIPMMEEGEEIQIKCTLTAAKVNVPHPNMESAVEAPSSEAAAFTEADMNSPTSAEKQEVEELLKRLNLT